MFAKSSLLKLVYLSLALLGAILPTLANIEFIKLYGPGFDLSNFIELSSINPAAQSLSRDLLVSSSAIFVWMIVESRKLKMKNVWIIVLSTFLIAIAFSAPLFLFLRELRIDEMERETLNLE